MSVEIVENFSSQQLNGGGGGIVEPVNDDSSVASGSGLQQTTVSSSSSSSSSSSGSADQGGGDCYDTAFPSLPAAASNLPVGSAWSMGGGTESKLAIKRHQNVTEVVRVPVEERKEDKFGTENNRKCEEIASRVGVKVEMCCSKDQTLHIVISGTEEKVAEAKRAIVNELQTERDVKIKIPKEQHKFLIGKSGAILKELQEKTCTKIQVPKPDSNLDQITIVGPKDGIELAIHEIQLICDEQSQRSSERLQIPKLYHPWLRGPNNEIAAEISARTGAKVNIPPPLVEKDEIVVSGDKEKVELACSELRKIYNAKSRLNITKVALQITKSQHKLIIGKQGSTVHDIFKDYDVYVQVPKLESNSETILLFGEEAKLGAALSQVIAKSNSVVQIKIDVPSWLHRHMIGEKGSNISKITADFPNTHVKFETDDKITLDGPPDEVERVRDRLENITMGLKQVMTCEELTVEPKFYPQLIGTKKTDNHIISKLNKEHGVVIRLPPNNEPISNVIRIEGPPDAVRKAKLELADLVLKLADERAKDIIIDQKFHSNLIGKGGKTLNEIRAKFNDVQINIPAVSDKSDVVTIRGNKLDVEKCYKYLQQLVKDMQESNYKEEIQIVKEFHRIIIGKGGAFIKKIRDDTHTRIDIPSNESESNAIVITGKQENVLKARKLIDDKIKELVNIKEDYVEIPHQFHTALIGKQGSIIKQIRSECGGVIISFPPESQPNDNRITLKGTVDDIKRAKVELLKLVEQRSELGHSEEITVKLEYHKFLVGRKGTNVNTLREKHGVRILFPSSNETADKTEGVITIIGKKENVKAARLELEETVKNLEEQITDEVLVDPKWHKNFTAKRGKLITEISDENCNVKISFPKTSVSQVQLKGPRDAVDAAKKRILDYIHKLENQVTLQVIIPQQYHAAVIGKRGANSQKISDVFHVNVQFKAKSSDQQSNSNNNQQAGSSDQPENGNDSHSQEDDAGSSPSPDNSPSKSSESPDVVLISGFKDDCEKARDALLSLVPQSEEVHFPARFHKDLLADKAKILKDLQQKYNVQVNVPKRSDQECDYVTVLGTRDKIEEAREALKQMNDDMDKHNFTVELAEGINISELIPQLRGRNGAEAEKLSKKFDVRLDFSKKGEPDKIVIRGLKENVEACETHLRKKIEDEESKLSSEIVIDSRVHSRIIGGQGKALAKIQEKFKVEIKFSGRNSDVVVVKGTNMDAIEDACDHLKNLEEEYLQDVIDRDMYTHPSSKPNDRGDSHANGQSKGFVVRGAPWEQNNHQNNNNNNNSPKHHNNKNQAANGSNEPVPDTNNMDLFPTISAADGIGGASGNRAMTWGPMRK